MSTGNEKMSRHKEEMSNTDEKATNDGPFNAEAGPERHDNEEQARLGNLRKQYGATWDSPDDPSDPYNWPFVRKSIIGVVMSLGALVTLIGASVTAPALDKIAADTGLDPETAQISFSIYFLGLAFGPFVIAAISEMNGRRNIWIVSNIWFILWNTLCPVGTNKGLLIAGRFLAATGASAGNTLIGPLMADMFRAKDRGMSQAIAAFLPYLGPALGPIIGGSVSDKIDWPWLFYVVSIINAVVLVIGFFAIPETYTPALLRRKAALQKSTDGVSESPTKMSDREFWRVFFLQLGANLLRPVLILIYRPVMYIICINLAVAFGTYTLMLSTFSSLWIERYGASEVTSSLHYIAISVGITVATQVGGRAMDRIYRHLRERDAVKRGIDTAAGGKLPEGKPEYRVPYMILPILLFQAGLFWYGWSAQYRYHWIVVDLGAAVFAVGDFAYSQALAAYTLDEFGQYAASAVAGQRVLSQIFGFAFPIFAPQLYETLNYGWANSLLAFIFIAIAFPTPVVLWLWGEKLRATGRRHFD
ncbi:MFS general substrate transporter [Xylariaceae sp. FL1272]|nr:MFS general substrate transporter [Xylariaceae sp. FL1272]